MRPACTSRVQRLLLVPGYLTSHCGHPPTCHTPLFPSDATLSLSSHVQCARLPPPRVAVRFSDNNVCGKILALTLNPGGLRHRSVETGTRKQDQCTRVPGKEAESESIRVRCLPPPDAAICLGISTAICQQLGNTRPYSVPLPVFTSAMRDSAGGTVPGRGGGRRQGAVVLKNSVFYSAFASHIYV